MPEGHKIHRTARDHQRDFAGQRVRVSSPQGRFRDGAAVLDGRKLIGVWAHGKHLFYRFPAQRTLHVHLGRYGRFRNWALPAPEPTGQVRLRMRGRDAGFDLSGPAACDVLSPRDVQAIVERLGPDPLRPDADPDQAWKRIGHSKAAIGTLLLDQSVVAGVGNIFRADVLFALKIHPERPGNSLTREDFDALWKWLVRMMKIGVKHDRIVTADPRRVGKTRSKMNNFERLLVYKREKCLACGHQIDAWEVGGRRIYACRKCQSW